MENLIPKRMRREKKECSEYTHIGETELDSSYREDKESSNLHEGKDNHRFNTPQSSPLHQVLRLFKLSFCRPQNYYVILLGFGEYVTQFLFYLFILKNCTPSGQACLGNVSFNNSAYHNRSQN